MAVNIIIDSKFDDKGIKDAQRQLKTFAGDAAKRVAQVGAAVAAAGAVAAGKLAVDAVQAASDFEESVNAVNVSFGEAAEGVLKIGENAAQSMGLSQNEFNQAAVRFSAFAERVVGEGGDVAGFIGDISQRAADFASVFNIEVSEALQVFQSGLAGEAEPLKRFGINLLQSEVAAFAMANGISASAASMTEAEKVQARYGLLLQETNKTAGDFANTSDSLANSQRILQAEISDLQVEIGQALLPVAKDLVNTFADNLLPRLEDFGTWLESPEGIKAVQDFGRQITNLVEGLLDFGGFIADNLGAIVGLGIAIGGATVAVKLYGVAVQIAAVKQAGLNATIALNPFGLMAIAVAGVTAALGLGVAAMMNYNDANKVTNLSQDELTDRIVETRRQLEFYREEQAKSENSGKLYQSRIDELETSLRELRTAQAQANGTLGEFSQRADEAQFNRLREQFGLTASAAGDLAEEQVRLSVVTQATMIHQDEHARAMRAAAAGQQNAGSFVRSIGEITAELYAKNKALMLGAEFTGDWHETLEEFEKQQNSSSSTTRAYTSDVSNSTIAVDNLSDAQLRALASTGELSSEIAGLNGVMSDGIAASDDFLAVLEGIDTTASQKSVSELTRDLQSLIVELDKAGKVQRTGEGILQFEQAPGQEVMAEFDEAGNLVRSYSMGDGPFSDLTNDINSIVKARGATTVAEIEAIQREFLGGATIQDAIDAINDQTTLINPNTGMKVTGGISGNRLDDLLEQGYEIQEKTSLSVDELNTNIKNLSDFVAEQGYVPFAKGGIVTSPTRALIGEAGPEAVIPLSRMSQMGGGNTYVINVNASNRTGGAQAGEEVVSALKAYNTTNGDFNRALTGFGA